MTKKIIEFDYEAKVWGAPIVKPSPFYIQGLKLIYTLDDLKEVRGKVIDIGCGGGNLIKAIKEEREDLEVYGVDISKKAIQMATKYNNGVTFKIGSVEKLPFKSSYFDAICMYDVLEHIVEVDNAAAEVYRVLKKGGLVHVFSPLDRQPGTLYYLLYKLGYQPKNEHTGHVQVFTDKSFISLMKKHGFKLVKKRFSFHFLFSVFDIAYFTLLDLTNKKASSSIEGQIEANKKSLFAQLFNLFYRSVIFLGFIESKILKNVPGGGGHYLFIKK